MKKATHIIHCILLILLTSLSSCDEWKWDENGDLDGMWQMTEWRDKATGNIIATNEDGIYYSFQLKLMKFQQTGSDTYHLSYFTHAGNQLIVGKTIVWPDDEECPLTDLAQYGVPSNGLFNIDALSKKRMQLSTDDAKLTFRKY